MFSLEGLIIMFMFGIWMTASVNVVREFYRDKKIYKQEKARLIEIGKGKPW
jgi:hypothetical protein